uniref:DNA-directed RNA polymerase n=1 Tax=Amphilophium steyermarkii TaxID=2358322 RepID=A0A4P9HRA4_9LAMI|nr:RNA polymerase alpha subunit [Amphilophium steyermarkii]YP_009662887.1 RNA polymerase alpha subunit [Amphilophium steyermarkii]QCU48366.1 RNA polymerase alpha subunit [Amphilophium steyermarkii]QCU48409.1 RNA polymerase alpha subunit [Amphilophium steyermarkii]
MIYEILRISTRETQWRCTELREDNPRLHYGRFFLAPLSVGQADLIGSVMRKALLAELEVTCITYVKLLDVPHEYSSIWGVEEPVYDIVMNLKKIVLRSNQRIDNLPNIFKGRVCVKGPTIVTAKDIIFNHVGIEVVDNTQHVATLTKPISLYIDVIGERQKSFKRDRPYTFHEGSYPIGGTFSPIRNVNYSTHSYIKDIRENETKEVLFLEIWTNGSLTPVEALGITSQKLAKLLTAPLHVNEEEDNTETYLVPLDSLPIQHIWELIRKNKTKLAMKSIYIDQLEFPPQVYNSFKKANIEKLFDLLNMSFEDFLKSEYFDPDDVINIIFTIKKYFDINFDLLQDR